MSERGQRRFSRTVSKRPTVVAQSQKKRPSFVVDDRIKLDLDIDLALALGDFILQSETPNSALVAFGHQLNNLAESDETVEYDDE